MYELKSGNKKNEPEEKKVFKLKKLKLLQNEMESLLESGFTGYVKINFSQGSIGRVEKFEEILKGIKNS